MGIISRNISESSLSEKERASLVEAFLVDDLQRMTSDQLAEFCAPGGQGEALVEAKKLGKKTFVRLSKQDDLARRTTMVAMKMAKEHKDPLFDKLALNRVKEKDLLEKINTKYGSKAEKEARGAQKDYIKTMKKVPGFFMKAGGAERV